MTPFFTSFALVLLTLSTIADSRTCKGVGGRCSSKYDCYSGKCLLGKCRIDPQEISDDKSIIIIDDMRLSEKQLRSGRIGKNYRWPNRTFPYEIDPAFTPEEAAEIQEGLDELGRKTCLRFVPRTNEMDWVYYNSNSTKCNSAIGRQQEGKQILNLDPEGCVSVGTVIHETIHALGFYHEQARYDRDDYVTINWENIPCKQAHNFDKYTKEEVDTFGVDYDYSSIMHYRSTEFSIDDNIPSIIPKKEGVQLGGESLTESDILKINRMYGC